MSESLIYISCFGLSANDLRMVQSIVQQLKLEQLPVSLLSKPSMDTHILIADSPSGDFSQLLQTAKSIPVRVFFAKQVVQAKNTISVGKPPQAKHLYEIIKKILAKLMAMNIQQKRPLRGETATPTPPSSPTPARRPISPETLTPADSSRPAAGAGLRARNSDSASHSIRRPPVAAYQEPSPIQEPPAEQEQMPEPSSDEVMEQPPKINSEHFFSLIYRAKREKKCLRVKSSDGPTIFVNGANKTIWQKNDTHIDIEEILASAAEKLVVNTIHEITAEPEGQIVALDNLLWKAAIICSNGKILDGHVMDQPITLKAWPNFTRQSFDPMHLKMSALLAKESMSLNQLSSLCQIPIEQVINFYNAAFAVDLIERRNKPREDSELKRKSTPVLKDMLSRLAKKLKIQ